MKQTIHWEWESSDIALGVNEVGNGASVVLLPALSSISTRDEMRPLFDKPSSRFHVTTVDWPGFGDRARPRKKLVPSQPFDLSGLVPQRSRAAAPRGDRRWTCCDLRAPPGGLPPGNN
jgi:hypothetical protein